MNWEDPQHELAKKEPRKGKRLSLEAVVATPEGPLVCYSCHLEVSKSSQLSWACSGVLQPYVLRQFIQDIL